MKKSHIFFGLAILAVSLYAIDKNVVKAECYEITTIKELGLGSVLLDKCKGRTWALVRHESTQSEILGYIPEANEEAVETLVWTRFHKTSGMLSFDKDKKK